ncbi:MAG: hypothetical protein MRJ68_14885 [Nitrospira sp.]|nr:hypothetical protein [Nitrospira sp.]
MSGSTRWFPTCQEMSRLLSDAMDRPQPWHLRARMYVHLRICALCTAYKQQLAFLRATLRHDRMGHGNNVSAPHTRLSDAAKARIRRALEASRL